VGDEVQTGSTRHVGHFWPIVPAPGDCEDGEYGGMNIGRENRSTRRKPAPATSCPPQIWTRTRAAAVGSQQLTAWAMARPLMTAKWRHKILLNRTQPSRLWGECVAVNSKQLYFQKRA
jgi:hypothetical protein